MVANIKYIRYFSTNKTTFAQEKYFTMFKNWIKASRPQTLPLSLSGVILGNLLAANTRTFSGIVFAMALVTAVLLQILSNFANDYGDGVKGTDKNRTGSPRMLQAGLISPQQMRRAIIITAILCFIAALVLIVAALGVENLGAILFFIALALSSIWAAVRYTMGQKAYGYSGWGDIFVFVFFGLVSVLGNYFLQTQSFDSRMLLPATFVGCLSAGVLNLNNIRDYQSDRACNKNTLVVKMGIRKAKMYHLFLIASGFVAMLFFAALHKNRTLFRVFFPLFILTIWHSSRFLYKPHEKNSFDSELRKLSLLTFLCSIFTVFCISFLKI